MIKSAHNLEFKLFYKIILLDRLLNDGAMLQQSEAEGDNALIRLTSITERSKTELKAQREEIAKQMFANFTEEDKKTFLKALSAVYKILRKVT